MRTLRKSSLCAKRMRIRNPVSVYACRPCVFYRLKPTFVNISSHPTRPIDSPYTYERYTIYTCVHDTVNRPEFL